MLFAFLALRLDLVSTCIHDCHCHNYTNRSDHYCRVHWYVILYGRNFYPWCLYHCACPNGPFSRRSFPKSWLWSLLCQFLYCFYCPTASEMHHQFDLCRKSHTIQHTTSLSVLTLLVLYDADFHDKSIDFVYYSYAEAHFEIPLVQCSC